MQTRQTVFQSTHPRRVRLINFTMLSVSTKISIHAPTKGATDFKRLDGDEEFISIHAPTKGATSSVYTVLVKICGISIHAPTKGATSFIGLCNLNNWHFNPRTHEGCDLASPSCLDFQLVFQSTHPRRVRQASQLARLPMMLFQSTHPRRVRHVAFPHSLGGLGISIHAPTKGATKKFKVNFSS